MASKTKLNKLIQLSNNEEAAIAAINKNVDILNDVINDYVSRTGRVATQMLTTLDMGSKRIINVGTPVDDLDVVRYKDVKDAIEQLQRVEEYTQEAINAATRAQSSATDAHNSAVSASNSEAAVGLMYQTLLENPAISFLYTHWSIVNSIYTNFSVLQAIYDDLTAINAVYNDLTAIDAVYADLATIDAVYADLSNIDYVAANLDKLVWNLSTETNALTIFGTPTTYTGNINIGLQTEASDYACVAIGPVAKATGGYNVALGSYSTASGNHALAIGAGMNANSGARATGDYSIQLGNGLNSTANTFSVGLSSSNNYQLLKSDGAIPFDRLKEIMIEGLSAPSTATVGFVSQLYRNTNTGKIYVCVGASGGVYTWQEVGTGGGGGGGGTAEAYDCPAITSVGGVCTWTISHTMDSRDIQVSVYDTTNYTDAQCNITRPTANSVVVTFLSSSDITAGAYRVVLLASSAYGLAPPAIKDCSDVLLTSVANGDLLKYDSSAQKWKNTKSLGDVTLGTVTATSLTSSTSSLGAATAATPTASDNSTKVATTAYVQSRVCTTKATTTSTASANAPAYVVENYKNDTEWYRVWSDGWIEQGGYISSNTTITYLKPFSDTNYSIRLTDKTYTVNGNQKTTIASYSSTQLVLSSQNQTGCWWSCCGY
jgi:hypothetical protein